MRYYLTTLLFAVSCMSAAAQTIDALPDSLWDTSSWISVKDAPIVTGPIKVDSRAADGTSCFVFNLTNPKKVVCAKWMTAGLGVYELYVNGIRIGEEVLKPGFTHYQKTKRSFTYDVTKAFNRKASAENTLAAQVTPGWWADKIVSSDKRDFMNGKRCAFRGVLELTYSDGQKEYFGTDTINWKAGMAGRVKHAGIFDGEEYDAREKMGFEAGVVTQPADLNTEYNGDILPTNGAEVYHRHDLALSPVRAYVWRDVENAKDGEMGKVVISREYPNGKNMHIHKGENLVVDFGQNSAAVPYFRFKAKAGTTLTCLPAELLNDGNGASKRGMDGPEGSVHRTNLRIHNTGARAEYTFAESMSSVEYTPRNTFFGYRYVSISATDDVVIEQLQSIPVTSIKKEDEIGTLTTGNELINKLISNTLWGQRSNYLSIPTDCPQRNERLGWTADTQVFTVTGSFFANTDRFFHKWLQDLRDTQSMTGAYPCVAPFGQFGSSEYMRVGWADAGVIVPWTIWKQFGDRTIIDESWESMEKFMTHVNETKYNHQVLIKENRNLQYGDWLSYEPLESCSRTALDGRTPKPEALDYWNFLSASYWAMDAHMMADMARACDRQDDAVRYESMKEEAKKYIREEFLTADSDFRTEILNTMQTPALFLLYNDILDGEAKAKVIARLRQNFMEHGNCLQTGFLGTSILMPVLTANGMNDLAYELLFQRKNPSWLYSVDNGATTIWERWNSYTYENGMGPKGMNSFNHYAYGCVCQWIWETAAGIASDPQSPGFKHIIMRPLPDKRLGHLDAVYHSAAGTIKSSWKYEGNKWTWKFTIPQGSTASVTLPGETTTKEYTAGSYTLSVNL